MQLSALRAALGRFVGELHRRKVLRVASGYVVVGWIALQVAIALRDALKLPEIFPTIVVSALVVGFPIVVVLTWMFELTPAGLKPASHAVDGAHAKPETTDWILIAMLSAMMVFAVTQFAFAPVSQQRPPSAVAEPFAAPPLVTPPPLSEKSIAVLSFVDMSPGKTNEQLADGIAEEIINTLAQIRTLSVISRTSSFAYKSKNVPLPEIGRQLRVRYILEGSVRLAGDDIRVTAQLIDVQKDTHLKSLSLTRKMRDIFSIEDEIAAVVASALDVEITLSAAAAVAPTKNLDAYRLYLDARAGVRLGTERDLSDSIALYQKALALDPNFAEAHAALAACYVSQGTLDARDFRKYAPLARRAAETARTLKPAFAESYATLAFLAINELDWEAAYHNTATATALGPSDSTARFMLGTFQFQTGALAHSYRTLEDTLSIDPLNSQIRLTMMGVAFAQGRTKTASDLANDVLKSVNIDRYFGHYILALAAREQGDRDRAERHFRDFMRDLGAFGELTEPLARALREPIARKEAVKVVKSLAAADPSFDPELAFLIAGADDEFADALAARIRGRETSRASFYLFFAWRLPTEGKGASPAFKRLMHDLKLVDYWKKHGWPDRCRAKGEDDFECS